MESAERVWLITGGGRGLGRAFVEAALGNGDRVVATIRTPDALADLSGRFPKQLRALRLDVRDRAGVFATVAAAADCFGRLDVVVNNAGYGLVGAIEEISEAQARQQLDTNLLGPLWICQAVLPHLRKQGSGHIVQVSTVGAVGSMPTFGLYNASKWALEGFSEALAAEVAEFGVRVTIAEFGGFATDWAWSSLQFAEPNTDYDPLRESLFGSPTVPWDMSGKGAADDTDADPNFAAAALLAHLDSPDGPLRLLVGDDAPTQVKMAIDRRLADYRSDDRF